MKRILLLLAAGSLTLSAGIVGSKHDLSATGNGGAGHVTNQTQVCIFCHTPHNAQSTVGPLWNRLTPAGPYTMDTAGTTVAANLLPIESLACLSCHDGSIAVGSLANQRGWVPTYAAATTAVDANGFLIGNVKVGTDLSNDHPINVTYPTADTTHFVSAPAGVKLYSGMVQCASCHKVHTPGDAASGTAPFLRVSNTASGLCTSCHIK